MHLIFIRHGDPDYKNNTITQKGEREAELLSKRIVKWDVTDFFVSPYGRAQDTIKPTLSLMGRTATTLDFLREFDVKVINPTTNQKKSVPWDWYPREFFGEKKYFNIEKCFYAKAMKTGDTKARYNEVCLGFDKVLSRYGYTRLNAKTPIYKCQPHVSFEEATHDTHLNPYQKDLDKKNLVFVCHLGVMFAIISHLTGISPMQLWQCFFVAPTSVTSLGAEERVPGEVVFRVQLLGDTSHLTNSTKNTTHEKTSASGFYGNYLDL